MIYSIRHHLLITASACILILTGCAPKSVLQPVWKHRLISVPKVIKECSPSGDRVLATSPYYATMMDGETGSVMWEGKLKNLCGIIKVKSQHPLWEVNRHIVFHNRIIGQDNIAALDLNNGKMVWNLDRYKNITFKDIVYIKERAGFLITQKGSLILVDAETGEEKWSIPEFNGKIGVHHYDSATREFYIASVEGLKKSLLNSDGKKYFLRIDMNSGKILWKSERKGGISKKMVSNNYTGTIKVHGSQVFLHTNQVDVYDKETGNHLWNTPLVQSKHTGSHWLGGTGVYGGNAEPVVTDSSVYLFGRKNMFKKVDRASGKVIWETKVKPAKFIPQIETKDNMIILRKGGYLETESIMYSGYGVHSLNGGNIGYKPAGAITEGNTFIKVEKEDDEQWHGPFGVTVLNEGDGTVAWKPARYMGRISPVIVENGIISVTSGKFYYRIDQKTGEIKNKIKLLKEALGMAKDLIDMRDHQVLVLDRGLLAINPADCSIKWKIKTTKIKTHFFKPDDDKNGRFFVVTESGNILSLNLYTGSSRAVAKADIKKGTYTMPGNGNTVFTFLKKSVEGFKTN